MTFRDSVIAPKNVESHLLESRANLKVEKISKQGSFKNIIIRFISRLSITQKISYGYSLAIGVAILGTIAGLVSGDYYQKEAQKQLEIADRQQDLIGELENAVGEVRSHPQRLVTVFGESIWFDYESAKFIADIKRVNNILLQFDEFIKINQFNLLVDIAELNNLIDGYTANTEAYDRLIKALWQQIQPANLKTEEIPAAQQELLNFMRGKSTTSVNVQFDRLAENLTRIKEAAQTQQKYADNKLIQAERLRLQIIATSMIISVTISIALSFYTSHQIARPIKWLHQIAMQVIQQSNFKLVAPVLTEDEIGSLAKSVNQLIEWVGKYTHELELSRQNLEDRVKERTQELQQALQELKQTQSQLIQSEKMSSLGQLVAGVAHEINNPVNFIYGNLEYTNKYTRDLLELVELYQQQYPQPNAAIQSKIEESDLEFLTEDLPKILSSMKMGTERIRQIVLSLRNFSRLDEADKKPVDIHEGIENTILILNNRLKRDIELIRNYGDLPLVECYPAQLNQVFMNIIANAIDVLEETKNSYLKKGETFVSQLVIQTEQSNNYIFVRIKDNGKGIPAEIRNKLFDPFFTTKPIGKGTGLGLSISYQIIEKHQGKIEVFSEEGKGTEFAIALPYKISDRNK